MTIIMVNASLIQAILRNIDVLFVKKKNVSDIIKSIRLAITFNLFTNIYMQILMRNFNVKQFKLLLIRQACRYIQTR